MTLDAAVGVLYANLYRRDANFTCFDTRNRLRDAIAYTDFERER